MDIYQLHREAVKDFTSSQKNRVKFIERLQMLQKVCHRDVPGYRGLTFYQYIARAFDLTVYNYKIECLLVNEYSEALRNHSYEVVYQAIRAGKLEKQKINRIFNDIDRNFLDADQKREIIREWKHHYRDRRSYNYRYKADYERVCEENEELRAEKEAERKEKEEERAAKEKERREKAMERDEKEAEQAKNESLRQENEQLRNVVMDLRSAHKRIFTNLGMDE